MIDQCEHCTVRGDIPACLVTKCSQHESWFAMEQSAEIKWLKADANTCGSGAGCLHKLATIDSQAAEIERLKEDWSDHVASYNLPIKYLRTENQKLQDALKWALDRVERFAPHQAIEGDGVLYEIAVARAALGDK